MFLYTSAISVLFPARKYDYSNLSQFLKRGARLFCMKVKIKHNGCRLQPRNAVTCYVSNGLTVCHLSCVQVLLTHICFNLRVNSSRKYRTTRVPWRIRITSVYTIKYKLNTLLCATSRKAFKINNCSRGLLNNGNYWLKHYWLKHDGMIVRIPNSLITSTHE